MLWNELAMAFIIGLRFDFVINSYILLLPFTLFGIASFITNKIELLTKIIFIYLWFAYSIILLILCSDIPYFIQFYSRLTTASLLWINDSKYMLAMIFGEKSFIVYLIIFITLGLSATYYLIKVKRKFIASILTTNEVKNKTSYILNFLIFTAFALILIFGIRGRLGRKSPIRTGSAYFCSNQTLNKLALNPAFTFFHSLITDLKSNKRTNFMSTEKAIKLSSMFLNLKNNDSASLAIKNKWDSLYGKKPVRNNIVIVIMESMGSFKLGKYNGSNNLCPNLNRIIQESIYFDNIYTAGIHTFNGIYSTLFSNPSKFKLQPLEEYLNEAQYGIAQTLKNNGYTTMYFTTHDPEFDNVSGFLKANSYDRIYSENDYPSNWVLSNNGIPDDKLFEYAIPILNNINKNGNMFFAAFMTGSDHKPYILPKGIGFKPKSKELDKQITEYADWSIGRFLEQASKETWYKNTTFVFIADHGVNLGHTYDMPLSYHRSPLIIYTPSANLIHDTLYNLGGQIDAVPTVLGLLNIEYINKTLGVNLFKINRPFMYFCDDEKAACIDKEYYLIIRPENKETLYRYKNLKTDNFIDSFPFKVDSMKEYMYSMMQLMESKRIKKQFHLQAIH